MGNSSLNGANNNPQTQQVNNPAQAQQDRLIEEGSEVEEGKGDDDDENDENNNDNLEEDEDGEGEGEESEGNEEQVLCNNVNILL